MDRGLVASYPFLGSAEESPNSNHAEVHGATLTKGHDGEVESAYSLDGTDDYLVVPHSESLSLDAQATFSLWWRHEPQASQHHLAASYDGEVLRVYLDGELSGERTVEPSGISQSNFEIFVGTDQYAPESVYTRGVIDELRIYNRALSETEIAAFNRAP